MCLMLFVGPVTHALDCGGPQYECKQVLALPKRVEAVLNPWLQGRNRTQRRRSSGKILTAVEQGCEQRRKSRLVLSFLPIGLDEQERCRLASGSSSHTYLVSSAHSDGLL